MFSCLTWDTTQVALHVVGLLLVILAAGHRIRANEKGYRAEWNISAFNWRISVVWCMSFLITFKLRNHCSQRILWTSEILLEVGNLQSQRAHPLKPCKTPRVKIQKSILATKDFLLWVLTLGFILCVKPPSASHKMTLVLGSICFEAQFGCFWRTWMKSQNLPVLLWVIVFANWALQFDATRSLHCPGPVKKAKINSTGPDSDVGTLSFFRVKHNWWLWFVRQFKLI